MHTIIYGIVLLILAFSAQAAEGYSWVDEDGQRHFSDIPAPGAQQVPLSEHNVVNKPEYGYEEKPEDPAIAVRKQQCERARARLDTLENAGTVIQRDELGNEKTIGPEERVSMIVEARNSVGRLCDNDS